MPIALDASPPEYVHPICQLCGYHAQEKESIKPWRVHTFQDIAGYGFHILACKRCQKVGPEEALGIYQKRVASGLDLNYH